MKEIKPGQRYGDLITLKRAANYINPNGKQVAQWKCKCLNDGNIVIVRATNLRTGKTKSCGCLLIRYNTTHGMTGTPEYRVWCSIQNRCLNQNTSNYHLYGGRGIRICKHWLESFENFYADMGPRPKGTSIDRKNNDLHYSCGHCKQCKKHGWEANCRWATAKEQSRNRRTNVFYEIGGQKKIIKDWIKHFDVDISYQTVIDRLESGMNIREALTTPVGIKSSGDSNKLGISDVRRIRKRFAKGGVSQRQIAKEFNVGHRTISHIVNKETWKNI